MTRKPHLAKRGLPLVGGDELTGAVNAAAFSPDGKRIVTGSGDNTAKVWDAQTGKEVLTLQGHTNAVWSVVFSPDGKRILKGSRDKSAKLW